MATCTAPLPVAKSNGPGGIGGTGCAWAGVAWRATHAMTVPTAISRNRPMPREPPVTRACLLVSVIIRVSSSSLGCGRVPRRGHDRRRDGVDFLEHETELASRPRARTIGSTLGRRATVSVQIPRVGPDPRIASRCRRS